MNVKNFIGVLENCAINGNNKEAWFFVDENFVYSTNSDGSVSLIIKTPTSDVFGVNPKFCFGFHDIKSVIKKLKTLGSDANVDFDYAGEYNGYQILSKSTYKRNSPLLKFPIHHPSAAFVLGNQTRNPQDEKFNMVGDGFILENCSDLRQVLSIIDDVDIEGKLVTLTFEPMGENVNVVGESVSFEIVCSTSSIFESFSISKRDFVACISSDSEISITIGDDAILLEQNSKKVHIPKVSGNSNELASASRLDDDFFASDFEY
tara:strand:- start:627 stop:1412 length:786 start_codon:yes stop_codon:yes gene_type:complete